MLYIMLLYQYLISEYDSRSPRESSFTNGIVTKVKLITYNFRIMLYGNVNNYDYATQYKLLTANNLQLSNCQNFLHNSFSS